MGDYPNQLGDTIIPTMDLLKWIATANVENSGLLEFATLLDVEFLSAGIYVPDTGFVTVPQNEIWIQTDWYTFIGASGAGAIIPPIALAWTVAETEVTIPMRHAVPSDGFVQGAAITNYRDGGRCLEFIMPGTTFTMCFMDRATSVVLGNVNYFGGFHFIRVRV